jgi:glycosyltransferase involved in cell wall biosynthesis
VEVVTTADDAPSPERYDVIWIDRGIPAGLRHLRCVELIRKRAALADVVYATSMVRRAAAGSTLARRALVVKLVADEVFERARRAGRFGGTLDEFQQYRRDPVVRVLRATRTAALRRARLILCPSAYLREVAVGWGVRPERLSVLPNPAPAVPELPSRDELRARLGVDGKVLAYAGRLTEQKSLDVALEALADSPEVTLLVAGEGPERSRLEGRAAELGLDGRIRFLGAVDRDQVLRVFRAADASLLSSSWENFPHTIVEALAVGTPVIATAVGGVPEVVRDGENGLLVRPGSPSALTDAIRRFFADDELRSQLSAAAASSVRHLEEERLLARIEAVLVEVAEL